MTVFITKKLDIMTWGQIEKSIPSFNYSKPVIFYAVLECLGFLWKLSQMP